MDHSVRILAPVGVSTEAGEVQRNLAHYHADWQGWGNLSAAYRVEHIKALCAVFQNTYRMRDRFRTGFQLWILIVRDDSSRDATYLHTPNPHSEFPVVPTGFDWHCSDLLPLFRSILPEFDWRCGRGSSAETTYWIWADGVGVAPMAV
jgi:hypothetical protein